MAQMRYYSTIDELIAQIKGQDISYRNLHTPVYIRYEDRFTGETDTYVIPYKSVILDYMPYLRTCHLMKLNKFDIAINQNVYPIDCMELLNCGVHY